MRLSIQRWGAVLLTLTFSLNAKEDHSIKILQPSWAFTTLAQMTLDEKIGQLFMVPTWSNRDEAHVCAVEQLISDYHVGNVIFFQGNPERQVALVNRYQKRAKYPLLCGQDCEWGLSMRLANTIKFPKNMTLGAIQDDVLVYELGKEIARQLRLVGVHVNFAPVVDVNTNPYNPIIGIRSFGAFRENVARKGILLAQGLQDGGVVACAKHFPGHGDTIVDSHYDLPVVTHSVERLMQEALFPFLALIRGGVQAVMMAHLAVPQLDEKWPSTLSQQIISGLLREHFEFNGLIFTDAMVMGAMVKNFPCGDAAYHALRAGNDVILYPDDVRAAIARIKKALDDKEISMGDLDMHVLKILSIKEQLGLVQQRFVDPSLLASLRTPEACQLKKKLYQHAVTLVRDEQRGIPLQRADKKTTALLQIGGGDAAPFFEGFTQFYLDPAAASEHVLEIIEQLTPYTTVVINFCSVSAQRDTYGKLPEVAMPVSSVIEALERRKVRLIHVFFTTPYALLRFEKAKTILVAYENDPDAWEAAYNVLFGEGMALGRLPIALSFYN